MILSNSLGIKLQEGVGINQDQKASVDSLGKKIVALDGLRGLAILLVLFHHSVVHGPRTFSGASCSDIIFHLLGSEACCGVDLFFALSGFLITRILIGARGQDGYYRNFYIRRFLRIFPLYYLFLLVMLVLPEIFHHINKPVILESLLGQYGLFLSLFAYIANFWMFFIPGSDNILIAQTWSLSIEEQFYLIWPYIVQHNSFKRLILLLSVAPFICLLIRYFLMILGFNKWQIRILTFGRFDAIGDGALLCLLMNRFKNGLLKYRPFASVLFVLLLLTYWYFVLWSQTYLVVIGYFIMPIMCTIAVYLVLTSSPNSFIGKIFSAPLMVAFGKYSYSIYLLHMPPLYVLTMLFDFGHGHTIIGCIGLFVALSSVMLLIGAIIYKFYERHFLDLKDKLAPLH